jgi:hypothetical protein
METPKLESDAQAALATFSQQCLDAWKLQYETSLQLLNAIVAGADRMREAQLAAVREMQGQQRRLVESLGKGGGGQALLAFDGKAMSDYVNGCLQHWSKLAELSQQTQADLMRIVQQTSDRTSRGARKA